MKSKYLLIIVFCAVCHIHLLKAQSSNSTARGFMTQVNSWISRLRGNNNNNNNSNNNQNNNSDKDKDKNTKNQQNQPIPYPGMVPYPVMPGLYGPMPPMAMPFAPRPIPATGFAPSLPFGSLAAGSSLGPSIGASLTMGPSIGASFGQLSPSYTSASHMMPVHHDYQEANQDYPVGYNVGSSYGNNYGGLSGSNYGSLSGGPSVDQMNGNTYHGDQADTNNADEYSGYHR